MSCMTLTEYYFLTAIDYHIICNIVNQPIISFLTNSKILLIFILYFFQLTRRIKEDIYIYIFFEKYVACRSNRFRPYKVYVYFLDQGRRVDLARPPVRLFVLINVEISGAIRARTQPSIKHTDSRDIDSCWTMLSCKSCQRNEWERQAKRSPNNGNDFKAAERIIFEETQKIDYNEVGASFDQIYWKFNAGLVNMYQT